MLITNKLNKKEQFELIDQFIESFLPMGLTPQIYIRRFSCVTYSLTRYKITAAGTNEYAHRTVIATPKSDIRCSSDCRDSKSLFNVNG